MKKYLITILIIFSSCQKHKMYYDIEKQELISCNNISFRMLSINGDEDNISLFWKDDKDNHSPKKINLNAIPKGYEVRTNGLKRKIKTFKLNSNAQYTIEKHGGGLESHMIRIWTDSLGRVLKTSNYNCNCGEDIPPLAQACPCR